MSNLTREQWLGQLAVPMVAAIVAAGYDAPKFRASVGFPKGNRGGRGKVIGQCWSASCSKDQTREIFIHPTLDDAVTVATTLLHELAHAALPSGVGHKGEFITLCKALGFTAPWTQTPATPELVERIKGWLKDLPAYPHAGMIESNIPKQTTRLIKCECPDCGYTVRTTQKWLDVGYPVCPEHGNMDPVVGKQGE